MAIFRRNTETNFAPMARYIFQYDNRLKLCTSAPPFSTIVNTLLDNSKINFALKVNTYVIQIFWKLKLVIREVQKT